MDSFLSGFSNNYGGAPIGQGYTGNVGSAGTVPSGSSQGVDITQLQPGDTFQGEIASVNGEDVQIQLSNGQYMAAKLERDVQVALGQVMTLQVQSNKDNRIVLKPVYDNNSQMLRVGEAALRAANMAVNDKNLELVSKLIENGMAINRKTLMEFNRLALQHPNVNLTDLIKLNKMHLPVNENNLFQMRNYQNMEHKLLDGIREASDEILKLYETLTGNQSLQGVQTGAGNIIANGMQGAVQGQAALENGAKFMEQVLVLLAGEEGQGENMQASGNTANGQNVSANTENSGAMTEADSNLNPSANLEEKTQGQLGLGESSQQTAASVQKDADILPKEAEIPAAEKQTVEGQQNTNQNNTQATQENNTADTILNQLKTERPQVLPNKIIALIQDGKLDIKGMKQLLTDSDLAKMLTTEQKTKIFHSEPFKSMLKNGLQKQWTLSPQDLAQEGKVEEFYQKLMKESSQLSRMMNEAMQASGQNAGAAQARAMGNISDNVEFMNQMNQMFQYIQLPLKFGNSQAHGDLYVYTNKKNMARRDGMLTAFLHLDMDHLGALDISIALQTERNQITTKFYLDEDSIALVQDHIGELTERLSKKGYQCKHMVIEKEEEKTVMEHIEEQVAGGSAVLSYQTFDTRA